MDEKNLHSEEGAGDGLVEAGNDYLVKTGTSPSLFF